MLWYQSVPRWFQRLFPAYVWERPGHAGKDVYLTFDDGPHPRITSWVMSELDRYGMKATFFCVGQNVQKYPDMPARLENAGHRTGNHTMHHLKGWSTPDQVYVADVKTCSEQVKSDLFRPPYGRIRKSQSRLLSGEYRIIMWSLLSCDFRKKLNRESALAGLIRKTNNGSIVVFHDSEKSEANLKFLLPPYLEYLHRNGFNCKTL